LPVDDADDSLVQRDPIDDERDECRVGVVGSIEERAGVALIAQVVAAETRQGVGDRDGQDPFCGPRPLYTTDSSEVVRPLGL
jgi:hypothetical protein